MADPNGNLTSLVLQLLNEIGVVQQNVATLQAQTAIILGEHQRASDSRAEIHRKIAEVSGNLNDVSEQLVVIKEKVERMEPLVEEHERKHQRGIGVVWTIRIAAGLGLGSAAVALMKVLGIKIGG